MTATIKAKSLTETHAELYRCEPRTIRRWRNEGAPLNDGAKMRLWLSSRKNLPEGTRLWLAEKNDLSVAASAPGTDEAPEETGAGNALRRLESAEADAYAALKKAMRSNDPFAVKLARESWLKIGDSLRRYDLMLDANRRASGELIQREHVEKCLERFATFFVLSMTNLRTGMVPMLAGTTSMPMIDKILEEYGFEGIVSGVSGYVEWNLKQNPTLGQTYDWMLKALAKGLADQSQVRNFYDCVEPRREFWRGLTAAIIEGNRLGTVKEFYEPETPNAKPN